MKPLPNPTGQYVHLNNDDLIVDTDLYVDGYSNGEIHALFNVEGETIVLATLTEVDLNAISDDLLRGKFMPL